MRLRGARPELFDTHGMSDSLRRSLYQVIWGVTVGMICTVVTTGASWTGFQREVLHADDFQLGLIAAIPVAANILQIFISFYMERKRNRRFLFLFFGILCRSLWILIGLLPFVIPVSAQTMRIVTTIMLVGLIATGNSFVNLGFASLMGDLIPMRIRGAYLSVRQKISLVSSVLAGVLVSLIVDKCGAIGYSVVLVLAGISGCLDLACFFRVDWPPMAKKSREEMAEKPAQVIREVLRDGNFMRFTLAFTLWALAFNVPAPFFNVFMLEELHMSYTAITVTNQIVSNLVTVMVAGRWGRLLDRFGNKPVLQFVCAFVSVIPLLWMLMGTNAVWLVVVGNILSGCFVAPIELMQMNLYLGLSPQKNRSIYVALFFACYNLLGIALGNALGGWLMQNTFAQIGASGIALLGMPMTKYRCLFLVAAVLRFAVTFGVLPLIREPGASSLRQVRKELKAERMAGRPRL